MATSCENDPASPDVPPAPKPPVEEVVEGRIPVIKFFTTDGQSIVSTEEYKTGTIAISDPDHMCWDITEFKANCSIRGRGNSTWGMPKKPYKIKLDEKARIFNMSNDKEWCLLANYCDKSLLRNITAMEISRRLGFSWTPKMTSVEFYLNGRYEGVYTFCEHKKVSKERVNINVDAGDILFEIEQSLDEPVCWTTQHGAPMMFTDPKNPTAEQTAYAKSFFKGFEDALWAKRFSTVYSQYIDKDSFIDNFIIQELAKNVDGNVRKSSFLVLREGGKLEFYHQWDFDLAFGNANYFSDGNNGPTGWYVKDYDSNNNKGKGWYSRLFEDRAFVERVQARWDELYPELLKLDEFIDKAAEELGEGPGRNFKKWDILGTYVWPNVKVTGSYEEEVKYLKSFYLQRLEWMNRELAKL